ncbi:hypothetical protein GCM10010172_83190 [Paractinoplanes ferrugineus]|uniref:Uncharacterized protein n=1 Tax=Paractinoplanes ferrugineus TaxID=113564 RepID=A0A919IY75_9ACTN|nr:hypothetical protein [Actinoplanes ferrugineus]GIE10640.1 hypothetical protein Afe05nite_24800 [Actinoplanes ferrugineus]
MKTSALRRALTLLAGSVRRGAVQLGADPLHALCRSYPEFQAAFLDLDLKVRIARALPAADPGQEAAKAARRDVEEILGALSDEQSDAARAWLRQTVGNTPAAKDRDGLLRAIRRRLEVEYALSAVPTRRTGFPAAVVRVARAAAAVPRTAFDQLAELAAENSEVTRAVQAFERSCLLESPDRVRRATVDLQNAVRSAELPAKERTRIVRAVETVAKGFERTVTTADGLTVVEDFFRRFNRLSPTHPMVDVYERLQSWLSTEDLEILGTALARCSPVPKIGVSAERMAEQIAGRVNVYVGLLGQLIGQKGAYRRLFEEQLRRAAAYAESSVYRVRVGRTPVRGLNKNGKSFAQFYDDTILLVDEAGQKVAIVFTAQFKAGDAGSLDVLEQLASDDARKALGKLLLDGKQYDIVDGLLPEKSAIVTTMLGVAEEQTWKNGKRVVTRTATDPAAVATDLADREVRFLPMPVDPADLRALIGFLLAAAEKIPAGG